MHDDQFKMLLAHLELSWEGYRRVRKRVKKKIARHMRVTGCGLHMQAYLDAMVADPLVEAECERLLAVSISRFLRDRPMWNALQKWLLRSLISHTVPVFRVWVAGCACGEEVYSFKMIWDEMELVPEDKPRLSLMATDLNADGLARARAGRYPYSSLKEVPAPCREAYFHPPDNHRHYEVRQWFKEDITWQRHDFQNKPPGNDFHMILLRNSALTYYAGNRRRDALARILGALVLGGALIVGARETMPPHFMDQVQVGPHRNIFIYGG